MPGTNGTHIGDNGPGDCNAASNETCPMTLEGEKAPHYPPGQEEEAQSRFENYMEAKSSLFVGSKKKEKFDRAKEREKLAKVTPKIGSAIQNAAPDDELWQDSGIAFESDRAEDLTVMHAEDDDKRVAFKDDEGNPKSVKRNLYKKGDVTTVYKGAMNGLAPSEYFDQDSTEARSDFAEDEKVAFNDDNQKLVNKLNKSGKINDIVKEAKANGVKKVHILNGINDKVMGITGDQNSQIPQRTATLDVDHPEKGFQVNKVESVWTHETMENMDHPAIEAVTGSEKWKNFNDWGNRKKTLEFKKDIDEAWAKVKK